MYHYKVTVINIRRTDEKWLQSALRFYWRKKQAQKTYRRQRTFIREKYADYGTLLLSVIKKRGATRLVSGKKKVEYNFPEKNYEVLRLLANQFESIASKQVSWTKSYSSDNEEQTPLRGLRRSSFYSKSEEASEEDGKKSWSFICKREIPRAYRQFFAQRNLKLSNLKRLSAMCQKEARFNAIKRFRTARETAAKNKKIMREVLQLFSVLRNAYTTLLSVGCRCYIIGVNTRRKSAKIGRGPRSRLWNKQSWKMKCERPSGSKGNSTF
jgi:hypothetical protein